MFLKIHLIKIWANCVSTYFLLKLFWILVSFQKGKWSRKICSPNCIVEQFLLAWWLHPQLFTKVSECSIYIFVFVNFKMMVIYIFSRFISLQHSHWRCAFIYFFSYSRSRLRPLHYSNVALNIFILISSNEGAPLWSSICNISESSWPCCGGAWTCGCPWTTTAGWPPPELPEPGPGSAVCVAFCQPQIARIRLKKNEKTWSMNSVEFELY